MLKNSRRTVIIGGTESDAHVVSIFIAAFMMEQHGYNVVNLSCQNKTSSFFSAEQMSDDVVACIICNQNGHARDDLRNLSKYRNPDLPVALAGHYTLGTENHEEQTAALRALGVDHFLDSLDDLLVWLSHMEVSRCLPDRGPKEREVVSCAV